MENKVLIGEAVKNKRIALNLTSEQLAIASGLSRSTLYSIEVGSGNYSIDALLKVFEILSLNIKLSGCVKPKNSKARARRINTKRDKKVNRFVIMCVEQYCAHTGKPSDELYPLLEKKGIITELEDDYEFLHTLSTAWINDYIDAMLRNDFL